MEKKVSLAEIKLGQRKYIVCEIDLLKNFKESALQKVTTDKEATIKEVYGSIVLNPNDGFLSDLKKITLKKLEGDPSRYFRGDFGKYYIADYEELINLFRALESRACIRR